MAVLHPASIQRLRLAQSVRNQIHACSRLIDKPVDDQMLDKLAGLLTEGKPTNIILTNRWQTKLFGAAQTWVQLHKMRCSRTGRKFLLALMKSSARL